MAVFLATQKNLVSCKGGPRLEGQVDARRWQLASGQRMSPLLTEQVALGARPGAGMGPGVPGAPGAVPCS